MRLDFGPKEMEIGTAAFNFVRALQQAGTAGADWAECAQVAARVRANSAEEWSREWRRAAEESVRAAEVAVECGDVPGERGARLRASNYFRAAMLPMAPQDLRLGETFDLSRAQFQRACALFDPVVEPLVIPWSDAVLPAYFVPARTGSGPRPTLVALNGGDSTNEELVHWIGLAGADRGWNVVAFEGPGQWGALQDNPGLYLRPDYEHPTAAVIDHLLTRADVDPDRIAVFGLSLSSQLAARVAAFEPRVKACVCDGLVVDVYQAWHAVWPRALQKAPAVVFDTVFSTLEHLSPQLHGLTNRFRAMFGVDAPHAIIDAWRPFTIGDLASRITCPVLVLYGEAEVTQSDERVARSAMRFLSALRAPLTLRMFPADTGWASSHCQVGGLAALHAALFPWLERAVNTPETLPVVNVDTFTEDVLRHHLGPTEAGREALALLDKVRAQGNPSGTTNLPT